MKFIQFGCWNKYGCRDSSGFYKVVENIRTEEQDADFLIICGDNYYQDKTNKVKSVNPTDLINGFICLNRLTENEIFLLLGNHDLEITSNACETLLLEKSFMEGVNSQAAREKIKIPQNLCLFKDVGDTLFIMLDTNIYANENPYCFNIVNNNIRNETIDTENQLSLYMAEQRQKILNYLSDKKYKNIIVSGHHPLIGFKNQVLKENKIKGGIEIYHIEFYKLFIDMATYGDDFYYLCADIHNFQEGNVDIYHGTEKSITIHQYIVGTGGADLDDDYNENYQVDYCSQPTGDEKILKCNINIKDDISINYELFKHWSNYGYNIGEISPDGMVRFRQKQIALIGGNRKKKQKTKKLFKRKHKNITR